MTIARRVRLLGAPVLACLLVGCSALGGRPAPPTVSVPTYTGATLLWHWPTSSARAAASTTADAAQANAIARAIANLPVWSTTTGSYACPDDDGKSVDVTFQGGATPAAPTTVRLSGCAGTRGHHMSDELRGALSPLRPSGYPSIDSGASQRPR